MQERIDILRNNPLFDSLSKDELIALQEEFTEEAFHKGDYVCQLGDLGDKLYIVVSGELEVYSERPSEAGLGRRLTILKRGDFFGELALFLGGERNATVVASQFSRLLSLDKESFQRFVLDNVKALEHTSRVIAQRLAFTKTGKSVEKNTTVISVVSRPGLKGGKTMIAEAVGGILMDLTGKRVLVVCAEPAKAETEGRLFLRRDDLTSEEVRRAIEHRGEDRPALLQVGTDATAPASVRGQKGSAMVSMLGEDYEFLVCDLGSETREVMHALEEFTDYLIEVIDGSNIGEVQTRRTSCRNMKVINLYNNEQRISINSCEPFVIPHDHTVAAMSPDEVIRHAREHPSSRLGLPLFRMTRTILGNVVGIALGGGAAFGMSHIGVLKVLEENDIPLDMIAGCSQGSMIGALYATGHSPEQMCEIARELGESTKMLAAGDFRLQAAGLLEGIGTKNVFNKFLGRGTSFADLERPMRMMTTDILNGEAFAIGDGPLVDAFRASSAVPMVWSPYEYMDRVLVDGGVSDPVPAGVLREMGANIVIAVNVVPRIRKGIESSIARNYRRLKKVNPLVYLYGSFNIPSMFDTIMNSMQTLQHELGHYKAHSADVRINPDLVEFTWIDYHRHRELIEAGVEAATAALPAIRKALGQEVEEPARPAAPVA